MQVYIYDCEKKMNISQDKLKTGFPYTRSVQLNYELPVYYTMKYSNISYGIQISLQKGDVIKMF